MKKTMFAATMLLLSSSSAFADKFCGNVISKGYAQYQIQSTRPTTLGVITLNTNKIIVVTTDKNLLDDALNEQFEICLGADIDFNEKQVVYLSPGGVSRASDN